VANRLANETSAYLLQHAENPVDWYAWGEAPFERARAENKPVLVSIGYSSCHWCHVMERESFENAETARLMNERLISIKVDREERPDVDQIYMDTIVRLTGHGGWPLNVFCAPDGRPFYGGTYFPPVRAQRHPSWREIVTTVADLWRDSPDQVETQATRILAALEERPSLPQAAAPGRDSLTRLCRDLMAQADTTHGGFGDAPKFPSPPGLEAVLLAEALGVAVAGARDHVVLTLRRMARGGIFDQLGGGFHRYSTDARWLVPHFEKMLYDQGQLLRTYAEAHRQTGDAELEWPVAETVDWLEREMRSPEGGFFSSQDADSEGSEGRFYVWDRGEVCDVLGEAAGESFCDAYAVTDTGTFEHSGQSVLEHALAGERPRFAAERHRLLEARAQRIAPDTDRKQILSWIGYTVGGLATAGASFERPEWIDAAVRAADFALERLRDADGGWLRVWNEGQARVPAFLDDHAALLGAFLDLQRAGGGERFGAAALEVAEVIADRFYDPGERDLYFTSGEDRTLALRPRSDQDGATPAAAGVATLGLVRSAEISGRAALRGVAEAVLETHAAFAERVPRAFPTLLRAGALLEHGLGVAVIVGDPASDAARALARRARQLLLPDEAVVTVAPGESPDWLAPEWLEARTPEPGTATAWLCRGRACSLPATDPQELSLP
jgi:uncharacterized protein YyaL (SSP411 family)